MTQERLLAGRPWRIRLIALFEALKGLLALALGFGVLDTLLEMAATFQALSHLTDDHREAVVALLAKRTPVFTG